MCSPREIHAATAFAGRRAAASFALCCALLGAAAAAAEPDAAFLQEHGIRYWLAAKQEPRTLRFHHLLVDLSHPRATVMAAPANDPDGAGPATAALEAPLSIARRVQAIALVNANPWQSLPDAAGQRTTNWREGMPVEVLGATVSRGALRSSPLDGHCAFWLDTREVPRIGGLKDASHAREAVAGFSALVEDGKAVAPDGGPVHPRTALGLDAANTRLLLVVVDGRQPGYSEGVALHELAAHMIELGCRSAVNLDGGGSSIMILAGRDGKLSVVNDPSTKQNGVSLPRPIPVALAIVPKMGGQE